MLSKEELEKQKYWYEYPPTRNKPFADKEIVISHLEALALLAEKNDTIESLSRERVQRMYYQDIVYDVCTILDRMFLNTISNGKSIVCGRFGEPTNEVQEGVERLGKKVSELNQLLAEKEKEIGMLKELLKGLQYHFIPGSQNHEKIKQALAELEPDLTDPRD